MTIFGSKSDEMTNGKSSTWAQGTMQVLQKRAHKASQNQMTDNNSADVHVILKALGVLVNGPDSVRALSGMTKHECSPWFP